MWAFVINRAHSSKSVSFFSTQRTALLKRFKIYYIQYSYQKNFIFILKSVNSNLIHWHDIHSAYIERVLGLQSSGSTSSISNICVSTIKTDDAIIEVTRQLATYEPTNHLTHNALCTLHSTRFHAFHTHRTRTVKL